MSIGPIGQSLGTATKELVRHWNETKEYWNDSKATEFEERFMTELIAAVERALPVFEELDKTLQKVTRDCE
jgi:hypothetical protein